MHILVFLPSNGSEAEVRSYGEYLTMNLRGQTTFDKEISGDLKKCFEQKTRNFDLVILGAPERAVLEPFLTASDNRHILTRASTNILVAQGLRWPIRKILLILRLQTQEESAVDWAGRIAHSCNAALTIQPILSAQSPIYRPSSLQKVGIDTLLTPATPSGEQLRIFLGQLKLWQVNGTLRARQGDPIQQLHRELQEEEYDLIIITAEQQSRLLRSLVGEMVSPLIKMVNSPILITQAKWQEKQHRSLDEFEKKVTYDQ